LKSNLPGRLIEGLFPTLKLQATPWWELWVESERRLVLASTRVTMGLAALVQIAHYFLIDRRLGLQPASLWIGYRFGMAAVCLVTLVFSHLKFFRAGRGYRLPLVTASILLCYFQDRSMVWFDQVPYTFGLVIAVIAALILYETPFASLLYFALYTAVQVPSLEQTTTLRPEIVSFYVVGFIMVVLVRQRSSSDIQRFIEEKQRLEAQKRIIELQLEMNAEVRAFLPGEINRRVTEMVQRGGLTAFQAMDEALRPRVKTVACLFSDIRGFTPRSKNLEGFVLRSALPEIRVATEIVERHRGVPSLTGDLIFAYFDDDDAKVNVINALRCAGDLLAENARHNASLPEHEIVKRFVLFSYGEALVGNIGGHDASREITALGSPVNVLSRIDALTKDPRLHGDLSPGSIIATNRAREVAREIAGGFDAEEIELSRRGIVLRDFPEEASIWLLRLSRSEGPVPILRPGDPDNPQQEEAT
jgi:class 3 adenylate cyclase